MSPMMASLGLRKGANFAPPPPPPMLSYVGGSPAVYSFIGGAGVDVNVPAGVVAGDTIVACVMHRGTVTPPDGFELIIRQDNSEAGRGYTFGQSASVYIKVAEVADEGGSFHFDSSTGFLGVSLVAVRHSRGWAATVEDVAAQWYVLGPNNFARHPVPVVRSGGEGRIAISMSSCIYALTSPDLTDYDPPQGWTGVTTSSRTNNRLSVAYLEVGEGAIEEGLYHTHGDFSNHDGVEIALVLSPEPLAYNYQVFLESGTWDWEAAGRPSHVDVLVVGGGGAGRYGAMGNVVAGGGGGAGGVVIREGVAVTGNVAVVVGAGGPRTNTAPSSPGQNSSFGDVVAIGGGQGGLNDTNARAGDGGSGGGGTFFGGAGSGTPGQGNDGANAITNFSGARSGGGGGAKTAGRQGEANAFTGGGGDGYFLSELGWGAAVRFGAPAWIAGGGGGGSYFSSGSTDANERAGPGGIGGGGWGGYGGHVNAGHDITGDGFDAQPNTGSGGGGGGTRNTNNTAPRYGGAGGSGLVIVRWLA